MNLTSLAHPTPYDAQCGKVLAKAAEEAPALIILCREVLVSGLREFLAQANVGVPVSRLAKWKTMLQMVALGFLLIGDTADPWVRLVGEVGLWIAAALTIITGYDYLHAGLKYIVGEPPPAPPVKAKPAPGPIAEPGRSVH